MAQKLFLSLYLRLIYYHCAFLFILTKQQKLYTKKNKKNRERIFQRAFFFFLYYLFLALFFFYFQIFLSFCFLVEIPLLFNRQRCQIMYIFLKKMVILDTQRMLCCQGSFYLKRTHTHKTFFFFCTSFSSSRRRRRIGFKTQRTRLLVFFFFFFNFIFSYFHFIITESVITKIFIIIQSEKIINF